MPVPGVTAPAGSPQGDSWQQLDQLTDYRVIEHLPIMSCWFTVSFSENGYRKKNLTFNHKVNHLVTPQLLEVRAVRQAQKESMEI